MVAMSEFRYSARSIAHLVDQVPARSTSNEIVPFVLEDAPLGSERELRDNGLAYHVVDCAEFTSRWQEVKRFPELLRVLPEPEKDEETGL
jgi:hypothetical protein